MILDLVREAIKQRDGNIKFEQMEIHGNILIKVSDNYWINIEDLLRYNE